MSNNEQYFQQIYYDLKDKIYRLCFGFMGNSADADDLFQEILIKIWNNMGSFRNESKISTWIYRIATNTALLHLKRKNKTEKLHIEFNTEIQNIQTSNVEISQKYLIEEQIKKLYQAVSMLKEIDRIIIGLLLEECSYKEISEVTGFTVTNVGARINRIKKTLRKKLK